MMMEPLKARPTDRKGFERNIFFLAEMLKQERLKFAPGINIEPMMRVRKLPNGRVDLLSIDEMARLQANMSAEMALHGFGMKPNIVDR